MYQLFVYLLDKKYQLFVYIFSTSISCLFTFLIQVSAVYLPLWRSISCLFTYKVIFGTKIVTFLLADMRLLGRIFQLSDAVLYKKGQPTCFSDDQFYLFLV